MVLHYLTVHVTCCLCRMLLDFCGNTSNEKPPQDMSELAMMEIVMKRYEKEAMHPFKGLSSGKLTCALSIQVLPLLSLFRMHSVQVNLHFF
ncbi:Os03g0377500 [Oryza sativa Japonica Group]|uniref:Os03g0377500 protein n=1 Tax=Oryza sativa subsp. japonica TaxID=39947 RepID=A0A0P0VXZ8_ORYSJ|nr:hypothetical protein EE612_017705 [Oryza sativa]BAS84422.1 Os03g0377500 [Oryza sativa Japonica Group]